MDAIILAGGHGVRLRPLTARRHKSLVPIANQAAIDHLLTWLGHWGIGRAILAMGTDNRDLAAAYPPGLVHGVEVVHVVEHERLESGGAIRNAVNEAGIEHRFLVVNGDVYVDFDLSRMLEAHSTAGAELTLGLTPVRDPWSFGVAVVATAGFISEFVEKPPEGTETSNLANAGVWIFERALVEEIPAGAVRLEDQLFPAWAEQGRALGYEFEGLWADVGTAARYLGLNRLLATAAGGAIIAPSAAVNSAAINGSVIGEDVTVGAGATITGSVLWEGVRVGAGATIEGSILANDVEIGEGASVVRVVAGAGAVIRGTVIGA